MNSKKYPNHKISFGNGGDRTKQTTPETKFCSENNVNEIFNVGGGKTQSSSNILDKWRDSPMPRPWGEWHSYREFDINNNKAKLKGNPFDTLTLFAIGGTAFGITSKGLKWELDGIDLSVGSGLGISNEFTTSEVEIHVDEGTIVSIQSFDIDSPNI